jgi:hypothetical protein
MNWDASERLAARVGERVGDLSSGHERWRIYRRALEIPQAWNDLLAAIGSEPAQPMASAAAVQLLEQVPPEMRNAVVGVLADGKGRDFTALRSRELGILESLSDGRYDAGNVHEHLDSWSTWLQLRAVGEVTDKGILAELARSGRTKRVRSAASERLRLPTSRARLI